VHSLGFISYGIVRKKKLAVRYGLINKNVHVSLLAGSNHLFPLKSVLRLPISTCL
jgi:hypothetical protein